MRSALDPRLVSFLTGVFLTLLPVLAHAGTLSDVKLALHAKPHAAKAINVCPSGPEPEDPVSQGIPCSDYTTQYPVGQSADLYLVAANGSADPGIAGIECGIDYDPTAGSGVDVFGWTLCSDLEFPSATWPQAGAGTRITWSGISNCQTTELGSDGVHAVGGAFYVYAYSDDVFFLTLNYTLQSGPSAAVADCGSAEYPLDTLALGNAAFGPGSGCNPCTALCGPCPDTLTVFHVEDGVGLLGESTEVQMTVANVVVTVPVSAVITCTVGGEELPPVNVTIPAAGVHILSVPVSCDDAGPVTVECRVDASLVGIENCSRSDTTSFLVDCVDPRPAIASILDVPDDQGGWVTVSVGASALDPPGYDAFDAIHRYNVWQRIEDFEKPSVGLRALSLPGAPAPAPAGPLPGLPVTQIGGRYFLQASAVPTNTFPPGTWELLGSFAAAEQPSYALLAPTLADASDEGPYYSVFVISAHTPVVTEWYVSEPDSGVSEDNLPPAMPENLDLNSEGLLTWAASGDPDFNYFTVYGSNSPGGESPAVQELLGYTTDPAFDTNRTEGSHSSYQVTATDFAGNEGPAASTSNPVPVLLAYLTAEREGGSATVRWKVDEARDHAGFHVFRAASGGERVRVTGTLLRDRDEYEYRDELPPPEEIEYWLMEVARTGEESWHGPVRLAAADPAALTLRMAHSHPNPFRDRTLFTFQSPQPGRVVLRILDVAGREVARPFDAWAGRGNHEAFWDGRKANGDPAPAGVYFYDLRGSGETVTRKLVKIR